MLAIFLAAAPSGIGLACLHLKNLYALTSSKFRPIYKVERGETRLNEDRRNQYLQQSRIFEECIIPRMITQIEEPCRLQARESLNSAAVRGPVTRKHTDWISVLARKAGEDTPPPNSPKRPATI